MLFTFFNNCKHNQKSLLNLRSDMSIDNVYHIVFNFGMWLFRTTFWRLWEMFTVQIKKNYLHRHFGSKRQKGSACQIRHVHHASESVMHRGGGGNLTFNFDRELQRPLLAEWYQILRSPAPTNRVKRFQNLNKIYNSNKNSYPDTLWKGCHALEVGTLMIWNKCSRVLPRFSYLWSRSHCSIASI